MAEPQLNRVRGVNGMEPSAELLTEQYKSSSAGAGFGWIWADLSRFQKCVRLLFAFSGRDAGVPRLIWVAGGSTGAGVDMSVNAAS